ncbi:MAG: hypothetical protein IKS48_13815 [Eubacterium sp.]|nr:hypothetical protein [Eubacterium sp.]
MKRRLGYIFTMLIVLFGLTVINILIYAIINFRSERGILSVDDVSNLIVYSGDEYQVNPDCYKILDEKSAFAMIIDDSGNVIWEYKKPEDVPDKYGMKDVTTFSRWYLNDYPVKTWLRDEGILVIGRPKNSSWKYNIEFNMKGLNQMLYIFPVLLVIDLVILFFLPILITRKWIMNRENSRTEWIAGVSHDIRTPLSIVMGSVEPGSVVERQCQKIKNLIGNLNTENKLESGTGKWNTENIVVVSLLREIICDFINSYEEGYTFELDADEDLEEYTISADASLIRRMIDNLIINSIVHNEKGCNIVVSFKALKRGKALISISDDGEGADSEKIKGLNAKLKPEYLPEHGLGIRVVKQVARKYRYKIKFSSEKKEGFKSEIIVH